MTAPVSPRCPKCGSDRIRAVYSFRLVDVLEASADGDWTEDDVDRDSALSAFHCADCSFETADVVEFASG